MYCITSFWILKILKLPFKIPNYSTLTLILLMWRIYWAPNIIPIYIQQDAPLHSLFISGNCSTCFGWYFHPSSGAHTTVSTASGICGDVEMWRIGWAPNSIPIYIQQDATLHSLFISGNCSTCFGWYFHPSSGAHTTVSTASGICGDVENRVSS